MATSEFDPATRVHIVGCPRSGTTLMTELMRYAYNFAGAAEHERSLFDSTPAGVSPYLTKKPADTVRIQKAFNADENLYVVALIRDPRAVITSVHWSRPDQYFVGFKRWQRDAEVICMNKDHPRYLVVRYEDLLTNPAETQASVDAHLPFLTRIRNFVDFPEGVEQLHIHAEKALGGVRPFDATRINSWQEHLGRVRKEYDGNPTFDDELASFGYETDASWTAMLEEVTPSGVSYKDRVKSWPKLMETNTRNWIKTRRYLKRRVNTRS